MINTIDNKINAQLLNSLPKLASFEQENTSKYYKNIEFSDKLPEKKDAEVAKLKTENIKNVSVDFDSGKKEETLLDKYSSEKNTVSVNKTHKKPAPKIYTRSGVIEKYLEDNNNIAKESGKEAQSNVEIDPDPKSIKKPIAQNEVRIANVSDRTEKTLNFNKISNGSFEYMA